MDIGLTLAAKWIRSPLIFVTLGLFVALPAPLYAEEPAPAAAAPIAAAPPPAEEAPPAPATVRPPEEAAAPPAAPPTNPPPDKSWLEKLAPWLAPITIGGGAILWFYQPTNTEFKNKLELYFMNLLFDAKFDHWGLHLEPRFRDSKLRPFFAAPVWVQEAYGYFKSRYVTVKLGKIYSQLGYFWDNSFYGDVQVYDGLKLDPNYGISAEGSFGRRAAVNWWLQYFVIDGGTNVSLQDRDTLSIPGAHRRNIVVARVEPVFKIGRLVELKLGASGQFLQADLPTVTHNVGRVAGDLKLSIGPWEVHAEYLHQTGKSVDSYPIAGQAAGPNGPVLPGQSSGDNHYLLAGTEATFWRFTLRYNFSIGLYTDVSTTETMHVPALAFNINNYLSLLGEVVFWYRETAGVKTTLDQSVNLLLFAHF